MVFDFNKGFVIQQSICTLEHCCSEQKKDMLDNVKYVTAHTLCVCVCAVTYFRHYTLTKQFA